VPPPLYSPNLGEKLSKKGVEQRFYHESGRHTEREMGQKGSFRQPVGLRRERL
jgi:hypothetical protein